LYEESEQQLAVETLIPAFTTALALPHFDHEREILVEQDASDDVSTGVVSQPEDEGVLHAVGYYSKKHSPAECNYHIYVMVQIPINKALEEWRPKSEHAACPLQLITDHKNIKH